MQTADSDFKNTKYFIKLIVIFTLLLGYTGSYQTVQEAYRTKRLGTCGIDCALFSQTNQQSK